jgi:microsomal dipeptidase-like Zn-dependent dipeptidase
VTWHGPGQPVVPHVCGYSSNTFAQAYLYAVSQSGQAPVALGTDFNGFAGLPGPRFGDEACPGGAGGASSDPVAYPFTALATGRPMGRSVIGEKTFDVNVEGLAHVGMLPDLIADLQAQGLSPADLDPLTRSAEGYLQAVGARHKDTADDALRLPAACVLNCAAA